MYFHFFLASRQGAFATLGMGMGGGGTNRGQNLYHHPIEQDIINISLLIYIIILFIYVIYLHQYTFIYICVLYVHLYRYIHIYIFIYLYLYIDYIYNDFNWFKLILLLPCFDNIRKNVCSTIFDPIRKQYVYKPNFNFS